MISNSLLKALPRSKQVRVVRAWRRAKRARRELAEILGSDRFSHPALFDIDRQLLGYLAPRGVFVEAGANDGFRQSNTYFLEKFRGWRGLLVEPIPALAAEASKIRRVPILNAALVAPEWDSDTISVMASGLHSAVKSAERPCAELGAELYEVEVPAMTLNAALENAGIDHVDFLSLDVEGYEPQVLAGLDSERYGPDFALIEIGGSTAAVDAALGPAYRCLAKLSPHDYLYARRDMRDVAAPS